MQLTYINLVSLYYLKDKLSFNKAFLIKFDVIFDIIFK